MGSALLKVSVRVDKAEMAWATVRRFSLSLVQPYPLYRSKWIWKRLELPVAHSTYETTHCYLYSKHHLPEKTKLHPFIWESDALTPKDLYGLECKAGFILYPSHTLVCFSGF